MFFVRYRGVVCHGDCIGVRLVVEGIFVVNFYAPLQVVVGLYIFCAEFGVLTYCLLLGCL